MPFAKTASLLLATLILSPAAALAASESFSGLLDGSYDYSRVMRANRSIPINTRSMDRFSTHWTIRA